MGNEEPLKSLGREGDIIRAPEMVISLSEFSGEM